MRNKRKKIYNDFVHFLKQYNIREVEDISDEHLLEFLTYNIKHIEYYDKYLKIKLTNGEVITIEETDKIAHEYLDDLPGEVNILERFKVNNKYEFDTVIVR